MSTSFIYTKCLNIGSETRGPKKHINFFDINFLAPTQNPPLWAPPPKSLCAFFPGKDAEKGPT